jgi:hypothetical protein
MSTIAIEDKLLERFHLLARETHRPEAEIINEALEAIWTETPCTLKSCASAWRPPTGANSPAFSRWVTSSPHWAIDAPALVEPGT